MARKLASVYGKRGLLLALAVVSVIVAAKGGGHHITTDGFFDGG